MIRRSFTGSSVVVLLLSLFPFADGLRAQCGVERWSVKTGTDPDAGLVNLSSTTNTTIPTMTSWTAPSPIPANNRVSPYETTQWVLNATLTEYKLETDSDYHLVLTNSSGNTMIAEIPSPSCVGSGSPFLAGIQRSRSEFDAVYTPTGNFKPANVPVQIRGVGMFDFLHGQTGVAPNGIEIHPVLDIVFNPTNTSDFSLSESASSVSIGQGGSGTVTVSSSATSGFNSSVALSASALPSGTTASFSPASIAAPGSGSSTMTIAVGSFTATGAYTMTITASGGGKTHSINLTLNVTAAGGGSVLQNGVPVSSISGATGSQQNWTMPVPSGATSLSFTISGGTGDADMYVKFGSAPTLSSYDCRPYVSGNSETCSFAIPGVGTYYVMLNGYAAYSGVTLTGRYTAGGGGDTQAPTTSVTAPANGATVSGTVTVSATGSDNVGVTKMEIYIDGALKTSNTNATAISYSWNTTGVANGNHTIQSKAYDAAGNVGTSSTVTVTVGNGGTVQQLLGNPGFETGAASPWVASSGVVDNASGEAAHSGSWKAWMDGYGSAHTDTIYQQVAIPSTATTAALSFWLHIDTAETGSTAYDTLRVQIRNSSGTVLATLATYSNVNAAAGYAQKSFNVIAYKGQTIQVYLVGAEDASLQTSFVVDDFALNVQ